MLASAEDIRHGETMADYVGRRDQVVRANVEAIARLIGDGDAFDIVELMRLREMPLTLTGYNESEADGLPAAIEIATLILVARGARRPAAHPAQNPEPHTAIEEIHARCRTLLTMGTFSALTRGAAQEHGPLTMLAAQYTTHQVNVKFSQYAHIHDHINQELFNSRTLGSMLVDTVGFSYEDFLTVRDAINGEITDNFFAARDTLAEVVTGWAAGGKGEQAPEEVERGKSALFDMMFYPGERASFTASTIAARADIDESTVVAILELFSVGFDSASDAVDSVQAFLNGQSPFHRASLLRDADQNYILLGVPIGTDCFRQTMEDALNDSKHAERYRRHRTRVSEGLTVTYLEKLLGTPATYTGLKYYRPRQGNDVSVLDRGAKDIATVADQTEADALFIVEDVAICVEVKGRSISTRAKHGLVKRLANDLRSTVGEATDQALRLESLIEDNRGLWLENRTWLDLDQIREIRSITICLDDIGPLGTSLDELVRAGVIQERRFPWVASLHDLAVISEILDRPAEFLLYLRRRTESDVSKLYHAVDELDLFMLFLGGGLYVEPDPDQVFKDHPTSGPPTATDRRRYKKNAIPTRVDTHTDLLDAWMYWQEGENLDETGKPGFISHPRILELVDFLGEGNKPGWFRFAADLLNLGDHAQGRLIRGMDEVVSQTRADQQPHTMLHCYAGCWGFPALFLATKPAGMSQRDAGECLETYLLAKKHQLRSDRALGVLLDESSRIVGVRYSNALPGENADLDELGKLIGLQSPERMSRTIPPSARRPTKRQKARKKRR